MRVINVDGVGFAVTAVAGEDQSAANTPGNTW